LKQAYGLLPIFFNSTVDYAIRGFRVKQGGLKLNATHQLLVCADDVNIRGRSVRTVKKNVLLVASKETGIEECADKTKYMVMSREQDAGRSHSMETDNSSFERLEDFKYLGTTVTNQNSIR
jgi:hypothetical protein